MKRSASVLVAVLLGALTTSIGVVPFLVLANQDRNRLTEELTEKQKQAQELEQEKKKIAEEANQKVEEANAEIQRAQIILDETKADQDLLTTAEKLSFPKPYQTYRWQKTISVYQELQFLTPQKNTVLFDAQNGFAMAEESTRSSANIPWLRISSFDKDLKDSFVKKIKDPQETAFIIDQKLIKGIKGVTQNDTIAYTLEARENATTTHLIWLEENSTLKKESDLVLFLSTFDFNE